MSKTKISAKNQSGKQELISTIQAPTSKTEVLRIRILYQGTCPKLTTRGRGDLSYELGIDEVTGDSHVRISANASSGGFSHEWLALGKIRTLLDLKTEQQKPFSAVTMESMFVRRSANNYGYLAAVMKKEGVLTLLPGKPVMLSLGSWEPILQKINLLKDKGVSLTDHIAMAVKEKAEMRAKLLLNPRSSNSTKPTKSTNKAEGTSVQNEPNEDIQEPLEGSNSIF